MNVPAPLQVPAAIATSLSEAADQGRVAAAQFERDHPEAEAWLFRSFAVQAGGYAPDKEIERAELVTLHELQDARTPNGDVAAAQLGAAGLMSMWHDIVTSSSLGDAERGHALLAVDTALTLANDVAQTVKGASMRSRPWAVDATLHPVGHVPGNNPSYPSGHATAAYAAAEVLGALMPERRSEFAGLASQVAFARLYAGMHFPSDVAAGARVGAMVGAYLTRHDTQARAAAPTAA
ncbi:MAG: phosphatase family protein [Thermoleophilia bacterium]|nr:phosphatase family protein [Thermoleophilia bacterium]